MRHVSLTPWLSGCVVHSTALPDRNPEKERTPPQDQVREPLSEPLLSFRVTTVWLWPDPETPVHVPDRFLAAESSSLETASTIFPPTVSWSSQPTKQKPVAKRQKTASKVKRQWSVERGWKMFMKGLSVVWFNYRKKTSLCQFAIKLCQRIHMAGARRDENAPGAGHVDSTVTSICHAPLKSFGV